MVLLESQIKLKAGDVAPDFELLGIDDKKHSINDYSDYKGILVIFMCNHCPYVKAKVNALNELFEKCGRDIAIIGINSNDSTDYPEDSFDAMKQTATEKKFQFDYLVDETQEIAKKYDAVCTPDFFGYNKNLELQYRGRIRELKGLKAVRSGESDLYKAMKQISETGKGPEDQVPSMGCNIKWLNS